MDRTIKEPEHDNGDKRNKRRRQTNPNIIRLSKSRKQRQTRQKQRKRTEKKRTPIKKKRNTTKTNSSIPTKECLARELTHPL